MTDAIIATGVVLKLGDGADPEVFVEIGEFTALTPPGYSADSHDATHLNSPDKTREFIQGLGDIGEISGTMHWTLTSDAVVRGLQGAGTKNFKMTFGGTKEWSFAAFLTGFSKPMTVGEKIEADVTLKITGPDTFADVA